MAKQNDPVVPPVAVAAQVVTEPVNKWRRMLGEAGAVVGKPWRRYRANIFLAYLVVAVIVFLVLAVLAKTVAYFTFDLSMAQLIQSFHPAWFDVLMRTLTWIGFGPQAYVITLLVLVALFVSGLKWETAVSAISVAGSTALGLALKVLVDRPRPSADLVNVLSQLNDFSFPSGHVLFFTVFFGFQMFMAYTLLKPSWWRSAILLVLGAMVTLVGVSRVYMGQHWPSDVMAAYLLGSVWLTATVLVYRWGKPRFSANQPVARETPDRASGVAAKPVKPA